MKSERNSPFQGAMSALVTPFDHDGKVDGAEVKVRFKFTDNSIVQVNFKP